MLSWPYEDTHALNEYRKNREREAAERRGDEALVWHPFEDFDPDAARGREDERYGQGSW